MSGKNSFVMVHVTIMTIPKTHKQTIGFRYDAFDFRMEPRPQFNFALAEFYCTRISEDRP